jgi:predicted metal-dependent hydrolase
LEIEGGTAVQQQRPVSRDPKGVQRMTKKWGSCSTTGIITLAEDLADQESGFQDFVIAHELLHLRVPNHGTLFKALMSVHVPDWRKHDVARLNSASPDVPKRSK